MGEGSAMPTDPHHTPIITQPSSSQPQRKQKSRRSKRKDTEVPQPSDPTNVADKAANEEPRVSIKIGRKIDDIDADAEITLVDETQERHDDDLMFDTCVLNDEEVFVGQDMAEKEVSTADPVTTAGKVVTTANVEVSTASLTVATITNVELTLAQTLPGVEECQGLKDKGKAKMIEPEKPLKKKDQIKFDEEEALRLQAEFDEEDRLAREKAQQVEEANIAWDDIQVKIDADYQLAERLQAHDNRNMAGWKPKDLKNKSFANIQELFDKAMTRVNTFVDMDTELVKGNKVRAEGRAVVKELHEIIPDEEEVAVDAIL
ncbi:hypothetical protein Tco_0546186 [Tanacetum coccineum]